MAEKEMEAKSTPKFTQEQVTEMMKNTVIETLKQQEEANKPVPPSAPYVEPYNYDSPSAIEQQAPQQEDNDYYYTPPSEPISYKDPRIDGLQEQIAIGARQNAVNSFKQDWYNLERKHPEINEYESRAFKDISEMVEQGLITSPEKMAASYLGQKALDGMGTAVNPGDTNVPPTEVNASGNPREEKSFKDMDDEEFEAWEAEHGNDKI